MSIPRQILLPRRASNTASWHFTRCASAMAHPLRPVFPRFRCCLQWAVYLLATGYHTVTVHSVSHRLGAHHVQIRATTESLENRLGVARCGPLSTKFWRTPESLSFNTTPRSDALARLFSSRYLTRFKHYGVNVVECQVLRA